MVMRIILSPAKKMKEDLDGPAPLGLPRYLERTQQLLAYLRGLDLPPRFTPESNMVFLALPWETAKALEASVAFEYQEALDEDTVCIRLVAGWYTTEADVAALLALLEGMRP